MKLDGARVLSEFDELVRRNLQPDGSGALGERVGPVVRWTTVGGAGWCGIVWSDLDESTANEVIAEQIAFFARRAEQFEWKLYSYDQPRDLSVRLLAAGFAAEDAESLMVADAGQIAGHGAADVVLPDGVRLVRVTDESGIDLMIDVHDRVFGADNAWGLGFGISDDGYGMGGLGGSYGGASAAGGYTIGFMTGSMGSHDRVDKLENTLRECLGLAPIPAADDPPPGS